MKLDYIVENSAIYATEDGAAINCMAKFDAFIEVLPFTATATDLLSHAVEAWQALQDGAAGEIAPYVAPSVDLLAYLADRRWRAETAGTTWNGWTVPTDERSQGKYLAELEAISLGVRQEGEPWKLPHGFEALSNAQIQTMAIAAREHVKACFALEAQLAAQVAAGTVTTTAEIDAAFAALA